MARNTYSRKQSKMGGQDGEKMVEHRLWKRVLDRRAGVSLQKNPLWVTLHPATLGGVVSGLFPTLGEVCRP